MFQCSSCSERCSAGRFRTKTSIIEWNSKTSEYKVFFAARWCRLRTGGHTLLSHGPMQYAADIAACRNGQNMSTKAFQHKWKHEIQIALLRRRAAMTRAVLPNTSARRQCLLAGLLCTEMGMITPTLLPSQVNRPLPLISQTCDLCTRVPRGRGAVQMDHHALGLEKLFEDHSCILPSISSTQLSCSSSAVHKQAAESPASTRPHKHLRASRWLSRIHIAGH